MSFNDIIVYVDTTEASKARVAFAVALAKAHNAYLIGVAFAPKAILPLYGADVGLADMSGVLQGVKAQGEGALEGFRDHAAKADVKAEGQLMQGMSEEFPHDFASFARQVDLTILGQPRDGDPLIGQYALVERCLFASGRPVMIVPAAAADITLDGTIVAAWDGSAEAARSFNDALTFLKGAQRVLLLVGVLDGAGEKTEPPTEGIVAHLGRHNVNVEVARVSSSGNDIGRLLLTQARDLKADMIVMGAFHTPRWREFILGGVTLTMLEEATIPLFMAH
jgi:nucleotide-binding universal stress UspA family protein